jgi:hypothetical protein
MLLWILRFVRILNQFRNNRDRCGGITRTSNGSSNHITAPQAPLQPWEMPSK